jgi:hypothetical protein
MDKDGITLPLLKHHVSGVLDCVEHKRVYLSLSAGRQDSHNEIEKLGVVEHFRHQVVYVSFETHLDYLLHCISGCSSEVVRRIPGYEELSWTLLTCDCDTLGKYSLKTIADIDEKLHDFVISCDFDDATNFGTKHISSSQMTSDDLLSDDSEVGEDNTREDMVLLRFFNVLFGECSRIRDYIGIYLSKIPNLGGKDPHVKNSQGTFLVPRSFGFSNIVFTAWGWPKDEPKVLDLLYKDKEHRQVKVHLFEPMEYLEYAKEGTIL